MDISEIKVKELTTSTGILLGRSDAPVKVIEFINLRCPYCRQWFEDSSDIFAEYVAAGKVQRIIKLFDKSKPGLDKGNIMHKYVPKTQEGNPLATLTAIYESQDTWGALETFEEVANFAETTLALTKDEDLEMSQKIVAEADAANIIFVPTMIIGDAIFDQKITPDAFKALLDQA